MGIITQRRKKRQAAQIRNGVVRCVAALGLAALAAQAMRMPGDWAGLKNALQAFSQSVQTEITLPAYDIYALQLAVFDSGERAAQKARQLLADGIHCMVWQREKMRIVVSAAFSRAELDERAAKGHEVYVIRDTLPEVALRLSAGTADAERAARLLAAPDALLDRILRQVETPMQEIVSQAREIARSELDAHPENALYTQLAQSLLNWCDLMEQTMAQTDEEDVRCYGSVTLCALCRELRQALIALSTASAQRTPSTAADVIPPA